MVESPKCVNKMIEELLGVAPTPAPAVPAANDNLMDGINMVDIFAGGAVNIAQAFGLWNDNNNNNNNNPAQPLRWQGGGVQPQPAAQQQPQALADRRNAAGFHVPPPGNAAEPAGPPRAHPPPPAAPAQGFVAGGFRFGGLFGQPRQAQQQQQAQQPQQQVGIQIPNQREQEQAAQQRRLQQLQRQQQQALQRQQQLNLQRQRNANNNNNNRTPNRFVDDLEVMKLAVKRDPKFFSVASLRLQALPELILHYITPSSAWTAIKTIPISIQREHPEITIKAIRLCDNRNLRYLPSHLPEELWTNNRDVCIAWIQRGGRVLECFERQLRNDNDMALNVAKYSWSEFYKVGERLLNDRDFCIEALEQDGRVFRFVSPTLRTEFDVAIVAVANHYNNMISTNISTTENARYATSVAQSFSGLCDLNFITRETDRLLELHETYVKEFLRGIAISSPHLPPARRSQLTMLDRGVETSQALKRLIAEYLGVPFGPKLTLLRKAKSNLERSGNTTTTTNASASNITRLRFHPNPRRFRVAQNDNNNGNQPGGRGGGNDNDDDMDNDNDRRPGGGAAVRMAGDNGPGAHFRGDAAAARLPAAQLRLGTRLSTWLEFL